MRVLVQIVRPHDCHVPLAGQVRDVEIALLVVVDVIVDSDVVGNRVKDLRTLR